MDARLFREMTSRPNRRSAARLADDRGSATVEFALIGVLFMFLIGICIQGALIYNRWLTITDISIQAARYGAPCYGRVVNGQPSDSCTATDVANYANQQLSNLLDTSKSSVTVSSSNGLITVTTTDQIPLVAPFVEALLPDPTTVTATASMRLENGGS